MGNSNLSCARAFYEHRLLKGKKAICHMEAFMAKFMAIYMKFVEYMFGGF